ncbi:MAG: hypothetical protein LBN04_00305 [Oscillospiraceae bacterium]|jgi:hypothetical protein|nr:hypothetical protein [Oscillospiraceae bacterium]
MQTTRTLPRPLRLILPLLLVALVVAATLLLSGSTLYRIEDGYTSRILAGASGAPDWRVREMNPLPALALAGLYRLLPAVPWYGGLMLLLLGLSSAAMMALAARRRFGLAAAAIALCPLLLIHVNAVQSPVVAALAVAAGAFTLLDALAAKGQKLRAVAGAVLCALGMGLHLIWGAALALGVVACFLPEARRQGRLAGARWGALVLAVMLLVLAGFQALLYAAPEMRAYRINAQRYERLHHSSLKGEYERLMGLYATETFSLEDGHIHEAETEAIALMSETVFDAAGWSLDDADQFFTRVAVDSSLADPAALEALTGQARFFDFSPARLAKGLFETAKKPQFLLLIGLLAAGALALLITSRRRGLVALLAVVIAIGGHLVMLAAYYDSYADIAPFYLLALCALIYHFNGEDAAAWFARVCKRPRLRALLVVGMLVAFVGGMGGILLYTRATPANSAIVATVDGYLRQAIAEHKDMLFIGDNPADRYHPDTLSTPARGADENLLAGSYDLYSPREAALLARFGLENPLLDSVGREDIGYVLMSFAQPSTQLYAEYDLYTRQVPMMAMSGYYESIVSLVPMTDEEIALVQAAMEGEGLEHEHEEGEAHEGE